MDRNPPVYPKSASTQSPNRLDHRPDKPESECVAATQQPLHAVRTNHSVNINILREVRGRLRSFDARLTELSVGPSPSAVCDNAKETESENISLVDQSAIVRELCDQVLMAVHQLERHA